MTRRGLTLDLKRKGTPNCGFNREELLKYQMLDKHKCQARYELKSDNTQYICRRLYLDHPTSGKIIFLIFLRLIVKAVIRRSI